MYSTYLSWYHLARRNELDCGTHKTWGKTNNKRRNYAKTLYHKYPTKIYANLGLFPCPIIVKMYNVAQSIQESPTFSNDWKNT